MNDTSFVRCVDLSPDCSLVASGCDDRDARILSFKDGTVVRRLTGHLGPVRVVAFSRDGRHLLTASDDGTVKVWDVGTGCLLRSLGHDGAVLAASWSPDGQKIVTGGAGGQVRVWSAAGDCIAAINGHTHDVLAASFSPDGVYVLTGGGDGQVILTNWVTKQIAWRATVNYAVCVATWSPDGTLILTAGDNNGTLWASDTFTEVDKAEGRYPGMCFAGFSPTGEIVAPDEETEQLLESCSLGLDSGLKMDILISPESPPRFTPNGEFFVIADFIHVRLFRVEKIYAREVWSA